MGITNRQFVTMPKILVSIRPLRRYEDFRQCERIQTNVWGAVSASAELLFVTQKNLGMVLGTFAGRRLVGFLFAFLGRRHGRLIHWSHMMAVERAYRDRGLGLKMKLAHRHHALEQGIQSIAWSFDPLQSRNAALNLARLGAEVDEYIPNCYGRFPSAIEKGLPSDRFVMNWRIASRRVQRKLAGERPPLDQAILTPVNRTVPDSRGLPVNQPLRLALLDSRLLVEIPTNTDRMRLLDIKLALRWRLETRRIFQSYLTAGYRVEDFLPPTAASDNRAFYVLARARA